MKIFFDDIEIDENDYVDLIRNGMLYNESFKIGTTICENYQLSVSSENINTIPEKVKIYRNDELYKTLYVVSYNEDDDILTLELEDAMTKFNFRYDASEIFDETGYTTLFKILKDICKKAEIETEIDEFYKMNLKVNWYDNTYMARDYLSMIAELNCFNLYITADNKLAIKEAINSNQEIDFNEIGKFKIGERHIITRVIWDGVNKYEFGDTTGETYYLNTDNVYILTRDDVENIYNKLNGFSFYNFKADDFPVSNLQVGDIITIIKDDFNFKTIVQYTNQIFSGNDWFGGIELDVNGEAKQETEIIGEDDKYRRIKQIVDRNTGLVETIVEETADITIKKVFGFGGIKFSNASEGLLYNLGIKGNLSLLFPVDDENLYGFSQMISDDLLISEDTIISSGVPYNHGILYPSEDLFGKDFIIKVDDIIYELDIDYLNMMNEDVYDEYIYESGTQEIIRRVGIDENGEMYQLDKEIIEKRADLDIKIKENSILVMPSFNDAQISSRYMQKNPYTKEFATKVELSSSISLTSEKIELETKRAIDNENKLSSKITTTAEAINLEVANKVGNNEVVSRINQSAEQVQINANKISLEGKTINLTSDDININSTNFKVDKNGNIEANNGKFNGTINGGSIAVKGNYNESNPYMEVYGNDERQSTHIGKNFIGVFDYSGNESPMLAVESEGQQTIIRDYEIYTTGNIYCKNIQSGVCTLTSSGNRRIYFDNSFDEIPNVVLTALTNESGVISAKISNRTTTYFDATIGGTQYGDTTFCYIAISN